MLTLLSAQKSLFKDTLLSIVLFSNSMYRNNNGIKAKGKERVRRQSNRMFIENYNDISINMPTPLGWGNVVINHPCMVNLILLFHAILFLEINPQAF